MGKGKILGVIFLLLGLGSIAMYFVVGDQIKSEFKVVFDSNGGTAVAEQIVKNGEINPKFKLNPNKVALVNLSPP